MEETYITIFFVYFDTKDTEKKSKHLDFSSRLLLTKIQELLL